MGSNTETSRWPSWSDLVGLLDSLKSSVFSLGLQRHHIGRFSERMLARLKEEDLTQHPLVSLSLSIEGIELGDNPFQEEFSLRFQLLPTVPERGEVPRLEELAPSQHVAGPIQRGRQVLPGMFNFTFTSAISVEENLTEFRQFIAKMIGDDINRQLRRTADALQSGLGSSSRVSQEAE